MLLLKPTEDSRFIYHRNKTLNVLNVLINDLINDLLLIPQKTKRLSSIKTENLDKNGKMEFSLFLNRDCLL